MFESLSIVQQLCTCVTSERSTSFGNKYLVLDDMNEDHNPQVCFPNGTTMEECGINGADTLKEIHWFPYSENVVSSLPYYFSKKDTMEEDEELEEYNLWKSTAESWLAEAKFQAGDVLFYNNDLSTDFREPALELYFIACKY